MDIYINAFFRPDWSFGFKNIGMISAIQTKIQKVTCPFNDCSNEPMMKPEKTKLLLT